jgi:hypothetical protein
LPTRGENIPRDVVRELLISDLTSQVLEYIYETSLPRICIAWRGCHFEIHRPHSTANEGVIRRLTSSKTGLCAERLVPSTGERKFEAASAEAIMIARINAFSKLRSADTAAFH